MKVFVIKPRSERTIRIESDLTPDKIMSALAFEPTSVLILDEERKSVTFRLDFQRTPALGKYGVAISANHPAQKIVQIVKVDVENEAAFTALVARAQSNLAQIETQVNAALEALETANKNIKEV